MNEVERCQCGRYTMLPEHDANWQPRDLKHTRDHCEGTPLTPAAQAVLDAAVIWADVQISFDAHQKVDHHKAYALLDAIRRYREEQ